MPATSPVADYYVPGQSPKALVPLASAVSTPVAVTTPVASQVAGQAVAPAPAASPSPQRVEFRSFASAALSRGMPYLIYLPAGYDANPTQRYPVLYLLHGIGGGFGGQNGSNTEWYGYGVTGAANKLIASGEIPPLLIVMPQGDQSFWMDHADGPAWGQYTAVDLVNEIDSHFRTIPAAPARAIGGLSMGGFGALELAMLYPQTFGTAGGHSSSFYTRDAAPFFGDEAFFDAHDPVHLLHDRATVARGLRLWLDVGSEDPLWKAANERLHQQLEADGVPHEWHEWAGAHDGLYWNAHVDDYMRFYGAALSNT
ncbi:MAG: hypothetical protein JO247_16290 [Chloroflexi bacterium]|nr:hypothetical protein [Chloroflexota bacterium]